MKSSFRKSVSDIWGRQGPLSVGPLSLFLFNMLKANHLIVRIPRIIRCICFDISCLDTCSCCMVIKSLSRKSNKMNAWLIMLLDKGPLIINRNHLSAFILQSFHNSLLPPPPPPPMQTEFLTR